MFYCLNSEWLSFIFMTGPSNVIICKEAQRETVGIVEKIMQPFEDMIYFLNIFSRAACHQIILKSHRQ